MGGTTLWNIHGAPVSASTALPWPACLPRSQLSNNQLSGDIPPDVGSLTALLYIHLSYNQLSGAIPPTIGSLTALQEL
ncbi:unnamed protein product [Closterium sp. Naga37s-1]|nr:unnamed protein product [Closterium sp. Naga37s-1]